MALNRILSFTSSLQRTVCTANLHTAVVVNAGQKFRLNVGKARSGNEFGSMVDEPDWIYEDGTAPAPTKNQQSRKVKREELVKQIQKNLQDLEGMKS
eukprot:m.28491 g.28491  ORF g.28491 m.28491 type:complete len:97 (-) comp8005_c0_seq1:341-631(-)